MAKSHVNCSGGEPVSRWNNAIQKLYFVAEVLRSNFQIVNMDYAKCIDRLDAPYIFFYTDPPYHLESRKSSNDYKYEFSDKQHEALADKLHSISGLAMVSGYDCDSMNYLYRDWNKIKFPVKKNNIRSGLVQEVIWINYEPK